MLENMWNVSTTSNISIADKDVINRSLPKPTFLQKRIIMQIYLVAAYVVVWLGIFIYLAIVALRIRGVRTELVAVEELVREQQAKQ